MSKLTLAVAVAGLVSWTACGRPAPESGGPVEAPEATQAGEDPGLRDMVLRGSAEEFSIEPVANVWGVLMETGYPEGAATLAAMADGSASLYFSTGGGVLGGGDHPSVNAAARKLVELAGGRLAELSPTSEFPLPARGEVTFYVLTTNGVLRSGARQDTLGAGEHPLSELFFAGHEVITGLREMSERQGR